VIIVDVNLLLYAVISGFPQHRKARAWWEETLNSSREVGLPAVAIFGFLRLSTNRRVFTTPLTITEALTYVRNWLAEPNVRFLPGTPRHLDTAFALLETLGAAGNLTTDAQLAAFAIEHHAELYSNDTDFARFDGLKSVNPLLTVMKGPFT